MTYSSSGSPNSYFRQLPDLDYPSLANERTSAYDYQIVKNIFKKIRNFCSDEPLSDFFKYCIVRHSNGKKHGNLQTCLSKFAYLTRKLLFPDM